MRTTLNIDDQLLNLAKHRAIEQSIPLSEIIENALRQFFSKKLPEEGDAVRLTTSAGSGVKPGIDLDNSRSLLDIMDDRV